MVALSNSDKKAIADAVTEAERHTAAEIVTVIAPASDAYQSYVFLYGMIAGSVIATGLWATKILVAFPFLLAVQVAVMALLAFIPWLRRHCVRLVPVRIQHHRAAHRAYEEYQIISQHVSTETPIVLLYVSLAEHYAHILTSRSVREKIADESWKSVIQEFTAATRKAGLRDSCIAAIRRIQEFSAPHFPERGEAHPLGYHVVERKH